MPPPIRTDTLDVYLLDRKVGHIDYSSHRNDMCFAYDAEYLIEGDAMALSYALPLQREPFDSERTTVFFENLLPPDQVRRKLGSILHLSRHNVFGFLEALGGDCAGAISLWPHGEKPIRGNERIKRLDENEAAEILESLKKRPLYVNGVDGYRISGSGAQNKLIARITDGCIELPLFGAPSTHIIKPAIQDYEDSVYNEFFAMRLAGRLGLATARCGLMRIKDRICYWTERFDREAIDGQIQRLHQEDFCQICGISGELKYESEGGPSFSRCMAAMQEMKMSLVDRFAFIDRMIYNYLIGNADAHGKNSSILYRGKTGRRLAPIYDVMSTAVYPNLSRVNAMSIGDAKKFEEVTRMSFAAMAEEVGMRPQLVIGRLDRLAAKIVSAVHELACELATEWPSGLYEKIKAVVEKQVATIARH
jgi:serine/threonine-protein kinase HipA